MFVESVQKTISKILATLCLPILLCGAGLDPIDPDAAGADFLPPVPQTPPGTQVVATIAGKWNLAQIKDSAGLEVPSLTLKTTDYLQAELNFTPRNYVTKWDKENDTSFHPQIRATIAFNPKIMQCDGLPLKLWFEDGETMNLGSFTCQNGRLLTGTDDTDKSAQDDREEDLAKFLLHHHPVAITQGRASLLLNYSLQKSFEQFQEEINPSLNPQYFKQARDKWREAIKKDGASGLQVSVED
ncbi:hypothetical protein FAI41_04460 [Acetobacteraceae bacterium]|nr:hypothetical protein FAI41_04460 [Acetobacteraceae bacterium]